MLFLLTDVLGLVSLALGQRHEAGKNFLAQFGVQAKEGIRHGFLVVLFLE